MLLIFSTNILFANNADDGKKKFNNIVVTSHGNYYEIIDNEKNVCIYIRIEQDSNGMYKLMCDNKLVKRTNKRLLKAAIDYVAATYIPATYGLSGGITFFSSDIADFIYEKACEYFE